MYRFPVFPGYATLRALSKNTSSGIFLTQSQSGDSTAIAKVYPDAASGSPPNNRFLSELSTLATLAHPGIVELLDFGIDALSGRSYVMLEHLQGMDIASAAQRVSRHVLVNLLVQSCYALDYIHGQGFVHGDLKPQHFILDRPPEDHPQRPHIKIIDFGSSVRKEVTGAALDLCLTPAYAAPEVYTARCLSPLSDLYSFGVVILDCLGVAHAERHLDPHTYRRGLRSTIDNSYTQYSFEHDLACVANSLLEPDPTLRAASASEVARQLISMAARHGLDIWPSTGPSARFFQPAFVGFEQVTRRFDSLLDASVGQETRPRSRVLEIEGPPGCGRTRLLRQLAVRCNLRGVVAQRVTGLTTSPWVGATGSAAQAPSVALLDLSNHLELIALYEALRDPSDGHSARLVVIAAPAAAFARAQHATALSHQGNPNDHERYSLPPLEERTLSACLKRTLCLSTGPSAVATEVHRMSGGNPSRAWGFVRWALDTGRLTLEHDDLRVVGSLTADAQVPIYEATLDALVRSLDDCSLSVLRILAVSTIPLGEPDLLAATGLDSAALTTARDILQQQGLAVHTPDATSEHDTIAGELVRASVHRNIPAGVSRGIHAALARALASGAHTPARLHARAGHTHDSGGDDATTAQMYFEAGQLASALGDNSQAIASLEKALSLIAGDTARETGTRLALWDAYRSLGLWPQALAVLTDVTITDATPMVVDCQILLRRSQSLYELGRHNDAVHTARQALRVARENMMGEQQAEALHMIGGALCWLNRRRAGVRFLVRSMTLARRLSRIDLVSPCYTDLASTHWTHGNYRLALAYERRRRRMITKLKLPHSSLICSQNIAILQTDLGNYDSAATTFRMLSRQARVALRPSALGLIFTNSGEVYRVRGRWKVALRLNQSGLTQFARSGQGHRAEVASTNISSIMSRAGHFRDAYVLLRHRLSDTPRSADVRYRLMYLMSWGRLLLTYGSFARAHKVAGHAVRQAHAAGLTHLVLEAKSLMAIASIHLGAANAATGLLTSAIRAIGHRSPFGVRLLARFTLSMARAHASEHPGTLLPDLERVIAIARRRQMVVHLCDALLLKTEVLLAQSALDASEQAAREAAVLARASHDRILTWKSHYWLGRVFEHGLRYTRALRCYRVAALVVRELAQELPKDRFRLDFLAQREARDSVDRYKRLRLEVGRRARHDLASVSRSEAVSRRMLASLSAIGQQLSSILDLEQLLASILDLAIENVGAERGVVFLRQEGSGELRAESARGLGRRDLEDLSRFSRSVIEQAAGGRTLLTVDVGQDPVLQNVQSLTVNEIKSILCVPMRARGRVAGVLYLDTQKATRLFTERDRAFVESFASQAAIAIENARLFGTIRAENSRLRQEVEGRFKEIIGSSLPIRRLREAISGLLDNDCTVLISGESGTGKGIVARAIHSNSERRSARFVAVDCGALPENLLEAELFGYRKGAFTGAERDRVGLFEEAGGGTLFLDEITNTSLGLQARLLRVLQEREVRRLGENDVRKVDIRVIAATNADIKGLMATGRFRQDLYYRLNVVTIEVPPLRGRLDDIPLLAQHFLARHQQAAGVRMANEPVAARRTRILGPGVVEALTQYDWPGNVRELENLIERLCVLIRGEVITLRDLGDVGFAVNVPMGTVRGGLVRAPVRTGEQMMIEDALRKHQGDKAKAARFIGWNRQKLYRRMKSYAIPADFGKAA